MTGFRPSSRVAWAMAPGAYAEAAIVDAAKLIPLPDDFSFEQGAAFSAQGITAHYLLHEFRKIKHGDVALIHAAAGGLGLLVVQWAKGLGARVIGTVSTEEKARTCAKRRGRRHHLYAAGFRRRDHEAHRRAWRRSGSR